MKTSVRARATAVKQPKGGYFSLALFQEIKHKNKQELHTKENLNPAILGLVVDYLTRFKMGTPVEKAFEISLKGAELAEQFFSQKNAKVLSQELVKQIYNLDDKSIISAYQLVNYDIYFRNGIAAQNQADKAAILPDPDTIENIRIMVKRCVNFFNYYGPVIKDGFSFEPHGYTDIVGMGDGDYLTRDTLWDFKVSKYAPSEIDTLQIAMYYIMGKHSGNPIYDQVKSVGIYNPRQNKVFLLKMDKVAQEIIDIVEKEVIGYNVQIQEEFEL